MPPSKALKIAITGNIGSGKSSFCNFLKQFGHQVLSADEIASEILLNLAELWHKRWGDKVFHDGIVDKEAIADIVFQDPRELDYLNSEIHPRVMQRFAEESDKSDEDMLFFEIPLLFEAKLESHFDYLVLVTAPREIVLKRLQQRNPGQLENLRLRLDSQIPDAEKAARVDLVIDNSQDLMHLKAEAQKLIESIPDI
ncbi:MAG: dephospho-CoA kinase [Candidatus Cloacimonadaceae bacterium]|jgi:dephospho-CoA kinase|nr:dephospho-CoA kinase [Candidatus Cloacimonadota bacterium]MDY0126553.1 dephospho-CoA kinase [Candidatus Cloacimonadaceae bacterium]MCB5254639.1 dephospho-CoA kinase [Candidatus Cloacimonadota bacterium]MCK9177726.1 dephospho-CoA kinase [Candidatus Cloacimonadota bacterium]MCK9241900.1 dephospho-CoA kinase [Candidatus Cloacimonadota bacterium]